MENIDRSKKIKKIIIATCVLIFTILFFVVAVKLISVGKPENSSVIVYGDGASVTVRIKDMSVTINDVSASDFYCDEENNRVFYTVTSSSEDSLFDLCCIELNRSEISDPIMIDYAVKSDFYVFDDNVFYLKYNQQYSAFEGYVCDLSQKVRRAFDTNVEGVYPFGSDNFYYTKLHGDSLAFYQFENSGSAATKLLSAVSDVNYYPVCDVPHIYVEAYNNETKSNELWYFTGDKSEIICEDLFYAGFDDYSPGGNLYYYTSAAQSVSWSYVISDEFVEEDKSIVKPSRDDFASENGISTGYNEAFLEYQDKLIRDEIREALNEMVASYGFNAPVYSAYCVNGGKISRVAENIDPSRVYAVSDFGSPKIVYERVELDSTSVDMATLVAIYPRNTFDDVIKYAWSVVDGSVVSDGICFAAASDGGNVEYALDFYDKKSTLFSFSADGNSLFAFIKDASNTFGKTVYCNTFGPDLMPLKEVTVSAGVTDYKVTQDGILYLKEDDGKSSGDVFEFSNGESSKISNAASAFIHADDETVVSVKYRDADSGSLTADYYLCINGEEELICEDAVASAFRFVKPQKAAYVAQNNLYMFKDGKTAMIDTDVKEIFLFV